MLMTYLKRQTTRTTYYTSSAWTVPCGREADFLTTRRIEYAELLEPNGPCSSAPLFATLHIHGLHISSKS